MFHSALVKCNGGKGQGDKVIDRYGGGMVTKIRENAYKQDYLNNASARGCKVHGYKV